MSKILDTSNNINLIRSSSTQSVSSLSGYIRSQRSGPTLYSIRAEMPVLNEVDYLAIEAELLTIDDGIEYFYSTLPEHAKLTAFKGKLEAQAGEVITPVIGPGQTTGDTIVLSNVTNDSNVKAGDFIQFLNTLNENYKVYQVKQDATAANNVIRFRLMQGVVQDLIAPAAAVNQTATYTFDPGTGAAQEGELTLTDSLLNVSTITLTDDIDTPSELNDLINAQTNLSSVLNADDTITVTFALSLGAATLVLTTPTRGNGDQTLTLDSTEAFTPAVVGDIINTGSSCVFKLVLTDTVNKTALPQNADGNLYSYSEFRFRESL